LVEKVQAVDQLQQSQGVLSTGTLPRQKEEVKSFHNHLHEKADSNFRKLEADRLRIEAIIALKDALKKPNLAKQTKNYLQDKIRWYKSIDYNSSIFKGADFAKIIWELRDIPNAIKYVLKQNADYRRNEQKDKEMLENPPTICDLLSDPSPKKFIDLIHDGAPDWTAPYAGTPRWMTNLNNIKDAFDNWFEMQGGAKATIVRQFEKMVSCKNRAPWASWSGKAWRGVTRNMPVIKKYEFTGEVKNINGKQWLVATAKYKSRYGAQSWTDDWRIATHFSESNVGDVKDPVGVIFELDLKREESLLSPDVIKKISQYGMGKAKEREVIRISDKITTVKIYVSPSDIATNMSGPAIEYGLEYGNKAKEYVYNKAVNLIGKKGADAFSKTKEFKDLVKDFT
jgi:hypothetical protein